MKLDRLLQYSQAYNFYQWAFKRHAPGPHVQVHEVAEGVQDRDHAQPGKQEGEHVAERQVVVDRSDQHQDERHPEAQSVTRRQDVDAALREEDQCVCLRRRLRTPPS